MSELTNLIQEDCAAYSPVKFSVTHIRLRDIVNRWMKTPGFRVTCTMRVCKYLEHKRVYRLFYWLCKYVYRRQQIKYGIQIGHRLTVGGGFRIDHYGGIVIGESAVLGKNLTIRQNVTIGTAHDGTPIVGDNTDIGAGAILIGGITIGDDCVIGAGAVVTRSFPDKSVIAGVPAKLLRKNIYKRIANETK